MRRLLPILLASLLALPVLVIAAPAAQACSCAVGSAARHLADADLVMEATAASEATSGREREYTFDVHRVWKGDPVQQVTVTTRQDESQCGRRFAEGDRAVVLAVRSGGTWATDLCRGRFASDSGPADLTASDVSAELGEGQRIAAEVATADDAEEDEGPTWPRHLAWLILSVVIALVVGIRRILRDED